MSSPAECDFCKQKYSFDKDSHESHVMLRVADITGVVSQFKQYCLSEEDTSAKLGVIGRLLPENEIGDKRWVALLNDVRHRGQTGCYEKAERHRQALRERALWNKAREDFARRFGVMYEEDFPPELQRRGGHGSSQNGHQFSETRSVSCH